MCWNEFVFAQKTSRKQFLSMSLTSRKYLDHVCCYLKPLKPKWGNLQASCKMKFDENLGYCTKLNPPETWLINLVKLCTYSSILQVRLFHSMNGSEAYTQFSHILHVFLAYTLLKIFPIVNRTKWFVDNLKISIRVLDFLWAEVYTLKRFNFNSIHLDIALERWAIEKCGALASMPMVVLAKPGFIFHVLPKM